MTKLTCRRVYLCLQFQRGGGHHGQAQRQKSEVENFFNLEPKAEKERWGKGMRVLGKAPGFETPKLTLGAVLPPARSHHQDLPQWCHQMGIMCLNKWVHERHSDLSQHNIYLVRIQLRKWIKMKIIHMWQAAEVDRKSVQKWASRSWWSVFAWYIIKTRITNIDQLAHVLGILHFKKNVTLAGRTSASSYPKRRPCLPFMPV